MKGLLNRSMEKREKIVIFYIDQDNNVTQRFIRVISMDDDSILAYCFWRKKFRTFKHENILSAGPARRKAAI
ncbi:hypothetical protein CWR48_15785 [Oceanobacillus arenosus]|uniref:WYL domain-containing protein n=1 Tax=Oceanobacillus arenosus TaxID=1229153 RepID=A0A3D8PK99_9BACI|nr:hypothetical protein [Oceanobacillus arenosus]RDW16506.1 hypothetical protein CWR48_15785 [Oceanobacillus arenosus]